MKVRIIGAGAMGLLVAARLFQSGVKVELVARTLGQAVKIRTDGLKLSENKLQIEEQDTILPVHAYTIEELLSQNSTLSIEVSSVPQTDASSELKVRSDSSLDSPDYILLMVKQTSITDELALELSKQLTISTRLVCFQNGIGHIDILSRYIAMEQIWIAVTTEGAFKQAEHHVRHTGKGLTWLGSAQPDASSNMDMQILQNLLNLAGFSTKASNNINSKVWNKLLMNAVINPVTAVLRVRNGVLPRTPAALPLMRSLLDEASLLADMLGVELAADIWEQVILVCEQTADNHSSMLQDVMAGRETEIEAITGGLLKAARRLHLQLPTHSAMYAMVRSIEQQIEII
ncbi:2-dehydropantoate 2-reductase [Paenibacillus sp. 1_12]|uniref:ketopantoate reductase family protein n=1 Tax=Paenibacillus sp. 1_12 TaxID=1566278 RepID=UPI0008EBB9F8|nr:2-dehydropantoate 2-reductase [Paenibacillus sp. 1_12]SFL32039.1 2-dehydropantoate 2-reductase [Paenibacillus sp. 1_12]